VEPAGAREYGPAEVRIDEPAGIFAGFSRGETIQVWMSHGDRLAALPPGFRPLGTSTNTPLCAIADERRKIYASSFIRKSPTPRAAATSCAHFSSTWPASSPTWTPASFAEEAVRVVKDKVGQGSRDLRSFGRRRFVGRRRPLSSRAR